MDDLTARLEALLRLYASGNAEGNVDARSTNEFRKSLQSLVAEYGPEAVDEALEKLPDEVWPSVSLH